MQTRLRQWEYYGLTPTFSELYEKSKNGEKFNKLYEIITSRDNILLAYRTIKSNSGSKTPGTDGITIDSYKLKSQEELITLIQEQLVDYKPKAVRRVYIPKPNGDKRPLGIPSMIDRIIQQMFKQVLEPICEAKFYSHSYGFRPLRSTSHAKSRCDSLINQAELHFVVDVDIKGFFDNVNHRRLMKQIWNIGIQDRKVLAIISKMLKAPIKGIGIPTKGTPQGGILSPLLSNIVLHDLDVWISNQWENYPSKFSYKRQGDKIAALKRTNLKEGYIVRYADDFKIFARNHKAALKWFNAVKDYLKERHKLDINPEKSKVVNLRKRSTDFLGFTLKATIKGSSYFSKSNIKSEKKEQILRRARKHILNIRKNPSRENLMNWNSFILGIHNYFKYATHVSNDFTDLSHRLSRLIYNRFSKVGKRVYTSNAPPTYKKFYGWSRYRAWVINGIYLYPMQAIKTKTNLNFSQELTPFTEKGRLLISKKLKPEIMGEILKLMKSHIPEGTAEYLDNRLSRYSMQMGCCDITGEFLYADDVHCHHLTPRKEGGNDSFDNLRIIHKNVHRLIHASDEDTIGRYHMLLNLKAKQIQKVNQYRKACNLKPIRF